MTRAYNRFIYHYFYNELYNKSSKVCPFIIHIFCSNARPTHRPPVQRLSSLDSSTCTSMASLPVIAASNGSKWCIGDPGICRAAHLRVVGNNAGPHRQSTPITVASESDHRSSYASPSNPSMTASQSRECHRLFGSASFSGSVCLAPSLLSSPHSGSVSVVCGLGCCTSSSSNVEESSGQLTTQWAPSLVIWAASTGMHGTYLPLLSPGKIIGKATHWNPPCFFLGWVICQDTPLKHQGPHNTQVGSPFICDPELCHQHHGAKVYHLAMAVAIQLCFCKGPRYGHCGWKNQLVPSV